MNRTHLFAGVLLALVLGGAGVASIGLGPLAGDGPADGAETPPDGEQAPDDPDAPADDGDSDDSDGEADDGLSSQGATEDELPGDLSVDLVGVEECGTTCRDVTTTVHNEGEEPVNDVTVTSRIFAGENSTDEDDLVWEGTQDHGTIEAGGSATATERVELSFYEAAAIERADGWITVETIVESDRSTKTFRQVRQAG